MRIAELYRRKRPVFSFEFFPPKTDAGVDSLFDALGELEILDDTRARLARVFQAPAVRRAPNDGPADIVTVRASGRSRARSGGSG